MCFVMYDLTTGSSYTHSVVYCEESIGVCFHLLSSLSTLHLYEKTDSPLLYGIR